MRIEFTETARKQFSKLGKPIQNRIFKYLSEVERLDNPRSRGKALSENLKRLWRYRVGDYRIICGIMDDLLLISVVKIGHRKDVY